MESIAVITGTLNPFTEYWMGEPEEVETPYGKVWIKRTDDIIVLPRHGIEKNIPPHMIEHRANVSALYKMGVRNIVAFYSVGSLKRSLEPGEILVVDDYINRGTIPTFFDKEIHHITPSLRCGFRDEIISIMRAIGVRHRRHGTYIQTRGPRLETRAEIAMLANFGDIVDMTMCSEATLAREKEIEFCPVCFIDNYCNGIVDEILSFENIRHQADRNQQIASMIIKEIVN